MDSCRILSPQPVAFLRWGPICSGNHLPVFVSGNWMWHLLQSRRRTGECSIKNLESFSGIYEVLKKNGNLDYVFWRYLCSGKTPSQAEKGDCQLAFELRRNWPRMFTYTGGINYTYPASFRKEVMINFHDSSASRNLKGYIRNTRPEPCLAFTEMCDASLRKEVIIIEDPKNDWLAEQLLRMERNNMVLPFFSGGLILTTEGRPKKE